MNIKQNFYSRLNSVKLIIYVEIFSRVFKIRALRLVLKGRCMTFIHASQFPYLGLDISAKPSIVVGCKS